MQGLFVCSCHLKKTSEKTHAKALHILLKTCLALEIVLIYLLTDVLYLVSTVSNIFANFTDFVN